LAGSYIIECHLPLNHPTEIVGVTRLERKTSKGQLGGLYQ